MADKDEMGSKSHSPEPEQAAPPSDVDQKGRRKSVVWSALKVEVEDVQLEARRTVEEAPPLLVQEPDAASSSSSSDSDDEPAQDSVREPPELPDEVMIAGRRKSVVWCASVPQEPPKPEAESESQPPPQPQAQGKAGFKAAAKKLARSASLTGKRRSVANDDKSPRRQSEKSGLAKQNSSERRASEKTFGKQNSSGGNRNPRRRSTKNNISSSASSRRSSVFDKKAPTSPKRRNSLSAVLAASMLETEASPASSDSPARKSLPEPQTQASSNSSSKKSLTNSSPTASRKSLFDYAVENQPKYLSNTSSKEQSAPQSADVSRRTSTLEASLPVRRPSVLNLSGVRKASVLEVSKPMDPQRRPSWRMGQEQAEAVGSRRPSRMMGLDDMEGKFRDNMTRRQIYSSVKLMNIRQDSSGSSDSDEPKEKRNSKVKRQSKKADEQRKTLSFYQISKAVSQAARKVVMKRRIADMFCGISYEHQLREELARVTQKSLKERDWDQLMVDLTDISEEINEREESKGIHMDLSTFGDQISQAISSLQSQQKAVTELEDSVSQLKAIEEGLVDDPEGMWVKLLDVKDHLKNLDRSTQEFSDMMMVLGLPKPAGKTADSDDSDEEKEVDEEQRQAEEMLKNVPQDVLERLKNTIADADHDSWEMQEEATRKELFHLGATEHDLPHVLRALRADAWGMCVDAAVVGLTHVKDTPSHEIKNTAKKVEEKLHKEHPLARERALLARRKRRQSFKVHMQRKMSVFNKRRVSVARPGQLMSGLQDKLAALDRSNTSSGSPSSPSSPRVRRMSVAVAPTHVGAFATETQQARTEAKKRSNSIDFGTDGAAKVVNYLNSCVINGLPENLAPLTSNRRSSGGARRSSLMSIGEGNVAQFAILGRRSSVESNMSGFSGFEVVGRRSSVQRRSSVFSVGSISDSISEEDDGHMFSIGSKRSSIRLSLNQLSATALAKDTKMFTAGSSSGSDSDESDNSDAMGPLPSEMDSESSFGSFPDADSPASASKNETRQSQARGSAASSRVGSRHGSVLSGSRGSASHKLEEIKGQYAGHMVTMALSELLQSISLRWSSFEEAQTFLSTCGGEIGGDGRIAVSTIQQALEDVGYRRCCAEVCCLFLALGVSCSECSTLSTAEFARLSNFADWHHPEESIARRAEFMLGQLELRRVLIESLTVPEKLLAQLHLGLARVSEVAGTRGRQIRTHDEEATDEDAALCLALHGCCMKLSAAPPESTDFAQAMITQLGLSVFVGVIALTSALDCVRIIAAYILSRALVIQGFAEVNLPFNGGHAKIPSMVDLLEAARLHAGVVENPASAETATDAHRQSQRRLISSELPSGGTLFMSSRSHDSPGRERNSKRSDWQSPSPRSISHEPREPTPREKFLMANLWRPLLEVIDPEGHGPPPPLDSRFLASLLQIFQQVHVPELVVGASCTAVAPLVAASLHKLHSSQVSPQVLDKLLKDFKLLEESHEMMENPMSDSGSSAQVHMLAVAFGGCRLLREHLAQLPPDCGSGSVPKGERILRMWRGIRQRLLLRWPAAKQPSSRLATLEAIKKATLEADKEGFALGSAFVTEGSAFGSEASRSSVRPMRLSCVRGFLFEEGSIELELIHRLVRRWQSTQALGRCVESSASLISREHSPGQRLSSLMPHVEVPSVRAQTAPAGTSRLSGTSPLSGRTSARLSPGSRAGTADGGQRFKSKVMPWTVPANEPNMDCFRSRTATPRAARHLGSLREPLSGKSQLPRSMTATPRAAGQVDPIKEQVLGKVQLPDKVQTSRSSTATPRAAERLGTSWGLLKEQLSSKVQLPSL